MMYMIPSGKLGEKYVKMITGDPNMTVRQFAKDFVRRAKRRKKELNKLIEKARK